MNIVNCHTHIFNVKCAPDRFLGLPLARLLSNNKVSFHLVRLLRNAIKGSKDDFFEKYANFLAIGRRKSQEEVFCDLASNYPEGTRFIVLTIDMDFMGAGEAILNYRSQLHEIINIKKKYLNTFFPFVSIDPRRGDKKYLLEFLKQHVEKLGFYGIKLYPSLGFFPFDPGLELVYEYAQENRIPVIVHCTKGGIYYRGKEFSAEHLKPANLNNKPLRDYDFTDHKDKRNSVFKDFFADPENYLEVLAKYPDLKLCFAHFGGNDEIRKAERDQNGDNWYNKIRNMMQQYSNVYTDISYTLYDKEIFNTLRNDIQSDELRDKILFGTDYFMTIRETTEHKLVNDFRVSIDPKDFEQIACVNPGKYLESEILSI